MKKIFISLVFTGLVVSCSKKSGSPVTPPVIPPVITPEDTTTVIIPTDPSTANTIGFFLNDWQPKTFAAPAYTEMIPPTAATATVTVNTASVITKIPNSSFGHNANTWMTPMIDQPAFMTQVTNLHPHIIRFPAGSGSDAYFWNQSPGTLPSDVPAMLLDGTDVLKDPGYMYGKTNDNWRASLDNYYQMLLTSGNQGMLTVNYGYARYGTSANPVATAAHLAADWVRYDNGRTQYWEVGNEVYADWEWGYNIDVANNKDGQPKYLTGNLYAQHFKVFADSMRMAAASIGKTIYIGAVAYESEPQGWQKDIFKTWNSGMMAGISNSPDFYINHNYYTPYNENSTVATILNAGLNETSKMMNYTTAQLTKYGAAIKPVAMTEWNMWAKDNKQQVSNISGQFAVIVQAEAIKNKFGMTARWDLLNGWENGNDHGLFSDGNEPGVAKWTPRPSFYYMYFYKKLLGDRMVPSASNTTAIVSYGSTFTSGQANVALLNTTGTAQVVEVKVTNFKVGSRYYWYSLEGSNDNGDFSRKVLVNGVGPTQAAGGPVDYATIKPYSAATTNGIKVSVPARGMIVLAVDKK